MCECVETRPFQSFANNSRSNQNKKKFRTPFDLIKFTTRAPGTSETSATQVGHECYMKDASAARVLHERHEYNTSEKLLL